MRTSDSAAGSIGAVHVGRVAPLGPSEVPSGFVKRAVSGRVAAGPLGLAGDAQADLRVHGGPDKAIYAYPAAHYAAFWRRLFPAHGEALLPGSMGENLSVVAGGWDERGVCIGDVYAVGEDGLRVQVTQHRQPCFKLSLRFGGDARLGKMMVGSGACGWYLRVVQPGTVGAGDALRLEERPVPEWSVSRFAERSYAKHITAEEVTEMARLPGLALTWREELESALAG